MMMAMMIMMMISLKENPSIMAGVYLTPPEAKRQAATRRIANRDARFAILFYPPPETIVQWGEG